MSVQEIYEVAYFQDIGARRDDVPERCFVLQLGLS